MNVYCFTGTVIYYLLCASIAFGNFSDDYESENFTIKKRMENTQIELQVPTIAKQNIFSYVDPYGVDADEINLRYYPGYWSPFKTSFLFIENGRIDGLIRAHINGTHQMKLIVPGIFETCASDFPRSLVKAYRRRMFEEPNIKYNIFCLNWKGFSGNTKHPLVDFMKVCTALEDDVINNTPIVAQNATLLLKFLLKNLAVKTVQDIHIVGFDIGGHVAGMIGTNINNEMGEQIGRITALDPPSLGAIRTWEIEIRKQVFNSSLNYGYKTLTKQDAEFVDVVHTDAFNVTTFDSVVYRGFGTTETMGDVDYFPNGGNNSPNLERFCRYQLNETMDRMLEFATQLYFCREKYPREAVCRHNLAYHFYAQSILDPSILAFPADNYKDFQNDNHKSLPVVFGEHINTTQVMQGKYYLDITPQRIFKNVCFENIIDTKSSLNVSINRTLTTTPRSQDIKVPVCTRNQSDRVIFWYNPGDWSDSLSTVLHYNVNETFKDSKLKKNFGYKFLIHGFLESTNTRFFNTITQAYRKNMKYKGAPQYNIIAVGWSALSANQHDVNKQLYKKIVNQNLEIVAQRTAEFIVFLRQHGYIKKDLSDVHIIGHGLGAIIAGITGFKLQTMINQSVKRITGLDPAGPMIPENMQLERRSAHFVDIYHTDMNKSSIDTPFTLELGLGFGTDKQNGDVDFYPNGGSANILETYRNNILHPFGDNHPCFWSIPGGLSINTCAHSLAYKYYADSINWSKEFFGSLCPSYQSYQCCKPFYRACPSEVSVRFGEYIDTNPAKWKHGMYFLTIRDGKAYHECTYLSCMNI